ncbi:hypothetical protein, partial [Micromonospora harpali]
MREIWPGEPYPLGGTWDGVGTNFSVFSEVAERVELCLFGDDGSEERLDLAEVDGLTAEQFQEAAENAKANCPVSKALPG